jgi:hypothetical protein
MRNKFGKNQNLKNLSCEKFLIKKEIVQLGTKCGVLLEGRKHNAIRVGEKDEKE